MLELILDIDERLDVSDEFREQFEEWSANLFGYYDDDAPCVVCGEYTEILCDHSEFDPGYHYCGRSPRCCP